MTTGIQIFAFDGNCAGTPLDSLIANDGETVYLARFPEWLDLPANYPDIVSSVNTDALLWVSPQIKAWWYSVAVRPFNRIGAFVRMYDTGDRKSTWCIIDSNVDVGFGPGLVLQYLEGIDFDVETWESATENLNRIRMEDPVKFCTSIPSWIPALSEARRRWVPVLSDFTSTVGQNLDLQGGVTSVDGVTVGLIADRRYSDYLSPLLRTQLPVWEAVATGDNDQVYEYFTLTDMVNDDTIAEVYVGEDWQTTFNGVVYFYPPSFEDLLDNDQFPYQSDVSSIVTEVYPVFMETEALWFDRVLSLEPNSTRYNVERNANNTTRGPLRRSQLLFKNLPTSIGMSCYTAFILGNGTGYNDFGFKRRYVGLATMNTFQPGMTQFSVEISSLTFTATVNSGQTIFPSKAYHSPYRKLPEDNRNLKIKPYVYTRQVNPEDSFRWVKLDKHAVPIVKYRNVEFAEANDGVIQGILRDFYDIKPGDGTTAEEIYADQIAINEASGTITALYYVGFAADEETFGGIIEQFIQVDFGPKFNAINPPSDPGPIFNRFTIIPLEVQEDETSQAASNALAMKRLNGSVWDQFASDTDITLNDIQKIVKNISNAPAELIHLFEPFCVGFSEDTLPDLAKPFYYDWNFNEGTYNARGAYVSSHPVDVILQVLTSTGTGRQSAVDGAMVPGWNGPWDVVPSEFSLGIPLSRVNVNTFKIVFDRLGPDVRMRNCWMELQSSGAVLDWLNETVLRPWFLAVGTDNEGNIVLIDLTDFRLDVSQKSLGISDFVRYGNNSTPVEQQTEYVDVADSFSYAFKRPFARWTDPFIDDQILVNGQRARSATGAILSGRIFRRIQTSPVSIELKWSPATQSVIPQRAAAYLQQYRRTLPKLNIQVFFDPTRAPVIGELINFALPYIPGPTGETSSEFTSYVGKVVDTNVDFRRNVQKLELLILARVDTELGVRWNLTMEAVDVTGDDVEVTTDTFVPAGIGDPFLFDYSVFNVDASVDIYDSNWRYKDTTTIVSFNDTPPTFTLADAASVVAGDRIVFTSKGTTLNIIEDFLAWQDENQRYQ